MPELPEVEVVRQVLKSNVLGLKITDIECFYEPIIENDFLEFKSLLLGKTITNINRLGKYLIFILENDSFISHLRMEGKYHYFKEDMPNLKHTHVVFHFDNGYKLLYQDVRKFGRMVYKSVDDIYTTLPLSKVGVEANSIDYSIEDIYNKIINKKLPIKTVLLDQTIISGLGNIYVDEVLFKSRINPHRNANSITLDEVKSIMLNSKEILDKAIVHKGTTIRSYTSSLGVTGNYQDFLLVHTKTICPICNGKLSKDKIGGRSSYYCKECQVIK